MTSVVAVFLVFVRSTMFPKPKPEPDPIPLVLVLFALLLVAAWAVAYRC